MPDETVLITASVGVGGSTIGTQQTVTITDDDGRADAVGQR